MLQKEKQNTYSKFNSACLLTSSFFLLTSKNQSCINFSCSSSQPANKKQVQDLTKRFFPKSCILYHQGFKTRYSIEKLCFLKKTTQLREERYHQSGVFKIFKTLLQYSPWRQEELAWEQGFLKNQVISELLQASVSKRG